MTDMAFSALGRNGAKPDRDPGASFSEGQSDVVMICE